jgi:hypothetical protein
MKKSVAGLLVAAALSFVAASPALAGSSTDAALGLGAFAVFNQILTGQTIFQQGFPSRQVIVQQPPPVIYALPPPPVVYAPPPPVVVYPSGYYSYAPAPQYYYKHYRRHRHEHDDDD